MAHEKFRAEVLTPEGEVFNDEVELVSTRTAVGSIGILAHHEPVLAILDPAELRLYRSESEIVSFAQAEGYMQVTDNEVLVLVEEALAPEAMITVCVWIASLPMSRTKGRRERSIEFKWPILSSAPKRTACFLIFSTSSGPWMPSGQPGKFSTSVVRESWPPGSWPSSTMGLRLARPV